MSNLLGVYIIITILQTTYYLLYVLFLFFGVCCVIQTNINKTTSFYFICSMQSEMGL